MCPTRRRLTLGPYRNPYEGSGRDPPPTPLERPGPSHPRRGPARLARRLHPDRRLARVAGRDAAQPGAVRRGALDRRDAGPDDRVKRAVAIGHARRLWLARDERRAFDTALVGPIPHPEADAAPHR